MFLGGYSLPPQGGGLYRPLKAVFRVIIPPIYPLIIPLKYLLYTDKAPYIAPRYAAYDTRSSKN